MRIGVLLGARRTYARTRCPTLYTVVAASKRTDQLKSGQSIGRASTGSLGMKVYANVADIGLKLRH